MLKIILNIIWVLFAGWELFILYVIAGLTMAVTVIGLPFALQAFKLAGFVIWPFGRMAVPIAGRGVPVLGTVANVIWLVLAGWWLALAHFFFGLILCITIIGIPLGIQSFKMMALAIWPFGREIVDISRVEAAHANVFYVD